MVDIGRNNRPSPRNLIAHEFRCDVLWDVRAKIHTAVKRLAGPPQRSRAPQVLPVRHVNHFLRNNPGARKFELRDGLPLNAPKRRWRVCERCGSRRTRGMTVVFRANGAPVVGLNPATRFDPGRTVPRKSGGNIDLRTGICIGARRVVNAHIRFIRYGRQRNFTKRNTQIRMSGRRAVRLCRSRDRARCDAKRRGVCEFGALLHGARLLSG